MDLEGVIVGTTPKRGRGPGGIVIRTSSGEIETTTWDSQLIQAAVGFVGQDIIATVLEKEGKEGKIYKNLIALRAKNPSAEQPGVPSVHRQPEIGGAEVAVGLSRTDHVEALAAPPSDVVVERAVMVSPNPTIAPTRLREPLDELAHLERSYAVAKRRYELIIELLKNRLKEGTHYIDGKMFGSKKPVLLQPGAYAILQAVGFSVNPVIVDGPTQAPDPGVKYTIVVRCEVFNIDGRMAGAAYGSASSHIWSGSRNAYVSRAIDPDKTLNSTIKISVKRSLVAACRQTTPASEIFDEDLEEGGYGDHGKEETRKRSNND